MFVIVKQKGIISWFYYFSFRVSVGHGNPKQNQSVVLHPSESYVILPPLPVLTKALTSIQCRRYIVFTDGHLCLVPLPQMI